MSLERCWYLMNQMHSKHLFCRFSLGVARSRRTATRPPHPQEA
jgi:hypothetical protein